MRNLEEIVKELYVLQDELFMATALEFDKLEELEETPATISRYDKLNEAEDATTYIKEAIDTLENFTGRWFTVNEETGEVIEIT